MVSLTIKYPFFLRVPLDIFKIRFDYRAALYSNLIQVEYEKSNRTQGLREHSNGHHCVA